jgi:hypothetical protein
MNYCSIEDAWGKNNCVSNQYNKNTIDSSNNQFYKNEKIIENFVESKEQKKTHLKIDELHDCEDFLLHIKNCRKCYNKMRHLFKPQLVDKIQIIIDENRDTIVLILIGISILLFFNLINNITK